MNNRRYLRTTAVGLPVGAMAKFDFGIHLFEGDSDELQTERERRLRQLIKEKVQAAVTVGWSQGDFLLSLVELSWNLYEERRAGD